MLEKTKRSKFCMSRFSFFSDQSHINLFSSRPQPKKKRKSRTAFTNNQIFELEKRFIYQKYLSPADRDEIAASLGLSNAQVRSCAMLNTKRENLINKNLIASTIFFKQFLFIFRYFAR